MSSHKHVVRAHRWLSGRLQSWIEIFESLEAAIRFANTVNAGSVKIYDEHGLLVHHKQDYSDVVDLYANK